LVGLPTWVQPGADRNLGSRPDSAMSVRYLLPGAAPEVAGPIKQPVDRRLRPFPRIR